MKKFASTLGLLFFLAGFLAQAGAPPNDNFAARMRITGQNVTVTGNSTEATREEGEPELFRGLGVTLWWGFTAYQSGTVRLTGTAGAEYDPYPDVRGLIFTGNSLNNLTPFSPIGFALNAGGSFPVTLEVVAGTEYQIITDTIVPSPFIGYRGPVTLHFEYLPTPTNDNFANRVVLSGEAALVNGSTVGATREPGEPVAANGYGAHTVWYAWTAPKSGYVDLQINSDTVGGQKASVYTNAPLNELAPVGYNPCCAFFALQGETFYFMVSPRLNDTGLFRLVLSMNGRSVIEGPNIAPFGAYFNIYGRAGAEYRVESSTNLVDWVPLSSGTQVDTNAPGPFRFYRAVLVP